MRFLALLLLLAACAPRGYRDPEDSAAMEREIEDQNIESRVRMALSEDPQTAPYGSIKVSCKEGRVTLEGEVGRAQARARAVRIAEVAKGVREVVDRLRAGR